MRKTVNSGSFLELAGSFEVERSLADVEQGKAPGKVTDRESGDEVTLGGLLRSFLADPTDRVTGPIRITIEPLR